MSLLEDSFEPIVLLERRTTPDGEGGFFVSWKDGAKINAAVSLDNSMQARTAMKQGVMSVYTVVTKKNSILQFHDVFRRERDGKIFRVTSDGDDKATPQSSALNARVVSAEEWSLPI